MKRYLAALGLALLCLTGITGTAQAASAECEGNFVNPITDVCWECIFPVTIGNVPVAKGRQPDTANPSMPIQFCPMGIFWRVGLAIGYWEPMALTDVTRSPYCMVNLGDSTSILVMSAAGPAGRRTGPIPVRSTMSTGTNIP